MKRKIILAGVLSFCMLITRSVNAQIAIDVTAIQRLIELKNLVDKAKKQLGELQKGNTINNGTRQNTSALLETEIEIENLLRTADDFLNIAARFNKFSDVGKLDTFGGYSKVPYNEYIQPLLWDQAYIFSIVQSNQDLKETDGMKLYDYIQTGRTAESQAEVADLGEYFEVKRNTLNRTYGLQTVMQKRKIQQALVYYKMAEEIEKKAFAMNLAVKGDIKGTPLMVANKGLFSTGSLANGDVFNDPFSFDNTWNDGAMQNMLQLQSGGTGTGGLLQAIGDLFKGPDQKMMELQVQNMIARAQADALKTAMASFQGSSGVNYGAFSQDPSTGAAAFGTSSAATSLRMTTGERIANQKGAIDLYVKAAELRQKGDELMFEAVQRTAEQKYVDGARERSFQRYALAAIKL
ncbi:hypothetical protein [Spirosoma panaciterrae]|uniref:hypothetical protein n=1 Tax=Spirosoma panaciterrae TaxID=496058 RepID=UPI0003793CD6|nr:hypothetical protein [Spirosoma panaciterrae]